MAKRGRWVQEDEIFGEHIIEMSKYVTRVKCAEQECKTLLFYNASGRSDDEEEYRVESCSCDAPALCCSKHIKTFKCLKCEVNEE